MGEKVLSPNERWCFPDAPPTGPVADQTRRWCFPADPARVRLPDPDEPWCFPEGPPRPGDVRPPRHSAKVPSIGRRSSSL
jgi:hypothetical protein